jgi:hypothetical protein
MRAPISLLKAVGSALWKSAVLTASQAGPGWKAGKRGTLGHSDACRVDPLAAGGRFVVRI